MAKILHLTLMKIYFEQIAKQQKNVEYRDIKPYWTKRLENRDYDEIHFKNGYAKDAPFMRVEFKGINKTDKYEILLGEILEIKNYPKTI